MIMMECLRLLTNTRFRPWRLPGRPFRLASGDLLPGAKFEAAMRPRERAQAW